ncbi:hypothetical protein [Caballeronia sp. Lep1P3]|uniref:hypothetical protein n=1 Tax=Caballeronia sp. Lep1P3 TaxID=2878150 RepID=UPI001FD5E4B1|nr:hypothetical protein [Caballeronia sp. Lep1P3]
MEPQRRSSARKTAPTFTVDSAQLVTFPVPHSPMTLSRRLSPVLLLLLLCAGCTVGYKNADLCKQRMIATYPNTAPKLTYDQAKTANRGVRVVVQATYKIPVGNSSAEKTLVKRKTSEGAAAVECTFDGETMKTFAWLTPPDMATRYPLTSAEDR